LKERFSQKNGPRIYQIQKSISSLSQDDLSVGAYFTKIKALWDELSNYRPIPYYSCGSMKTIHEYFHHEYVFQFLMGLNDSFSHIRGQILLIDPLPPINQVFALVLQEERQREASASVGYFSHNSAAMMSKVSSSSPNNRFGKTQASYKVKPTCSHCGIVGHTMEKCYRVHGYPPGFKFTKNRGHSSSANTMQDSEGTSIPHLSITQEQCQQLLALLKPPSSDSSPAVHQVGTSNHHDHLFSKVTSNFFSPHKQHSVFYSSSIFLAAFTFPHKHPWIIDTGATNHMVSSIKFFTTITTVVSSHVKLPNRQVALVTHIGTVKISDPLLLTNVLCVPSFNFNLVSASKLLKNIHCCLIFIHKFCFVQNLTSWETIGVGEEKHGLFYLVQPDSVSSVSSAFSISNVSEDIWHYRLGHLSSSRLNLLHASVPDISINSKHVCTICPLAKHKRLPFPISNSVSDFPFELLHCDIWGPFSVKSNNGSFYFLIIVVLLGFF
jgi:hypothetical protein